MEDKPFPCRFCSSAFSTSKNLDCHVEYYHDGVGSDTDKLVNPKVEDDVFYSSQEESDNDSSVVESVDFEDDRDEDFVPEKEDYKSKKKVYSKSKIQLKSRVTSKSKLKTSIKSKSKGHVVSKKRVNGKEVSVI